MSGRPASSRVFYDVHGQRGQRVNRRINGCALSGGAGRKRGLAAWSAGEDGSVVLWDLEGGGREAARVRGAHQAGIEALVLLSGESGEILFDNHDMI